MNKSTETDSAEDASDAEVSRFENSFLATRRTLDEAIRNLEIQLEFETDPDRRNQLGEEIARLKAQRDELSRANIAFHAHSATMVPPSAKQVKELTIIADKATKLTVNRASAQATVKLVTSAVKRFSKIQKFKG